MMTAYSYVDFRLVDELRNVCVIDACQICFFVQGVKVGHKLETNLQYCQMLLQCPFSWSSIRDENFA